MSSKISTATALTGAGTGPRLPTGEPAPAPHEPRLHNGDPIDYRLVIEEDEASGSFVYKTLDRRTGEVVNQFPREQMLKMAQDIDYEAGAVITTKA